MGGLNIPIWQMGKLRVSKREGIEDHCMCSGSWILVFHCLAESLPPKLTVLSWLHLGKRELEVVWLQELAHRALFEKKNFKTTFESAHIEDNPTLLLERWGPVVNHQSLLHN